MKDTSQPILVILGSSRRNGETASFLENVMQGIPYQIVNLLDYRLHPYRYSGHYPENDDFGTLTDLILQHPHILLATPIYWYAMSGLMKTFFDRLTDLITIRKEAGRKLKGKSVSLLAVGADEELPPGFTVPFQLTAQYLDMEFTGSIYSSTKSPLSNQLLEKKIRDFRNNCLKVNKT